MNSRHKILRLETCLLATKILLDTSWGTGFVRVIVVDEVWHFDQRARAKFALSYRLRTSKHWLGIVGMERAQRRLAQGPGVVRSTVWLDVKNLHRVLDCQRMLEEGKLQLVAMFEHRLGCRLWLSKRKLHEDTNAWWHTAQLRSDGRGIRHCGGVGRPNGGVEVSQHKPHSLDPNLRMSSFEICTRH